VVKWIAAGVAIVVTLLLASRAADPLELPVRDLALRLIPSRPATSTAVVVIDEASLEAVGHWPWPRAKLAELVDRIADAGARGVILDVLLVDPLPGDEILARSLRRLPAAAVSVLTADGRWLVPSAPIRAAATPAHGNFELDHDGIVRRFATTKQNGDLALVALPIEAATMVTGAPVPVGVSLAPAFRTRPYQVPQVSAADVFRGSARLRGRIVFVGPTAFGLGDRVLTPVAIRHLPDPGVTVHAAAAESLIRREIVREAPPIAGGIAAAIAVAFVISRGRGFARPRGGEGAGDPAPSPPSRERRHERRAVSIVLTILIAGELLLATTGVAIPFVTLAGSVVLAFAVIRSRTLVASLRRTEAVASRLRRDREDDVESKRVLAHELKTPLASMRGLTQLLGGFELTEAERRRVTSLLEAEAGKLQSLVGGLLDLERLPLRDFDKAATVINLGELVAARLELLRASADRPIVMFNAPELFVRGDAALIERVIDNLVGNALRYAPPPEPVRVGVRDDRGLAILEVEDRGPGIPYADRDRVFQRFFRGASAGGTQGLGLGLSLVAEVARWHGGVVTVEEGEDGGARFRFALNLVASPVTEPSKAGATAGGL